MNEREKEKIEKMGKNYLDKKFKNIDKDNIIGKN